MESAENNARSLNFIETIIEEDLQDNKNNGKVHFRFPPEPNGYLHIGHAKSICLNFGLAEKYDGLCNLRFDDTNPTKEDVEYVDSIKEDILWLGFQWNGAPLFTSDYFAQLYSWAVQLIKQGKAYVDEQSQEEISRQKGVPTRPGTESPYRDRPVEENLLLLEKMKNGEVADGAMVLRAKIDMSLPNMQMRDPIMYRVLHAEHHRTGNKWSIYPMYDFALRLVSEPDCGGRPSATAADRICPSEPELHGYEQTQTAGDGGGKSGFRMGRPAYANDFGLAPKRLYPGINT